MTPSEFFTLVLPDDGQRCLVAINSSGKIKQLFRENNSDAETLALKLDSTSLNVYFGCASFSTNKNRKAENALAVKSFWLDIDCGEGKPYARPSEGAAAAIEFSRQLGWPNPTIVASGRGVHVYWPFTQAVPAGVWREAALILKALTLAHNMQADQTRTADVSSVLRVPGTHNRKAAAKLVRVIQQSTPTDFEVLLDALVLAAAELNLETVLPGVAPANAALFTNNDLTSGVFDGPLPSSENIIAECAVVRHVVEEQADVSEPLWFHALGIALACEGEDELAHRWSSQHPDYTFAATQAKIELKRGRAPPLCSTLQGCKPEMCAACPHFGKIRSPMKLAYASVPVTDITPVTATGTLAGAQLPPLPYGYTWFRRPDGEHTLHGPVMTPEKTYTTGEISDSVFYPVESIECSDGTFEVRLEMHYRGGLTRQFTLKAKDIAEGGVKLAGELGKHQITIRRGMDSNVQEYLKRWLALQRTTVVPVRTYESFGWHADDFVIGDTIMSPHAPDRKVILAGTALAKGRAFDPRGSLDDWKSLVHRAYAAAGQEPYQFMVLTSFAAPLLSLFDQYGGIVVYMHSEGTGAGKTTTERVALSAWGNWQMLQLTDKQVTANALYQLLGAYSNLPVIYDEMTNQDNATVGNMVHLISAGRSKDRCASSGQVRNDTVQWSTIVAASGNMLLSEKLAQHRANAEAEISRIFEFTLRPKPHLTPSEAAQLFPAIDKNAGHAGREYIRYVVDNKVDVYNHLMATFDDLVKVLNLNERERYWGALIACVMVAYDITSALGLLAFPRAELCGWIEARLQENRGQSRASIVSSDDLFGQMISDLWPGILVTQGEGNLHQGWDALVLQHPRGAVVGRATVPRLGVMGSGDKARIFLSSTAARAWCNKKGISAKEVFAAAVASKSVTPAEVRLRVGRGSSQYAGLPTVTAWEIDWSQHTSVGARMPALTVIQGGRGTP